MKTSIRIISAAAIIACGFAGAAFAHQGGAMGGMGMHGAGMGMMGHHGAEQAGMRGMQDPAQATARLAAVKAELKITAAQEPAWQKYEAVVSQQAQAHQTMRDGMRTRMQDPKAAATVDHAAQRDEMMKLHEAHRAERDAARRALVAALSPEQKALAEQRLGAGQGMGMGHGMKHGMGHGMGYAAGPGRAAHQHTN
jgi:hypothetical protein